MKYILAVNREITWLYLHTNVKGRKKLNALFKKHPFSIEFDDPLVKKFSHIANGVLTNVKKNARSGNFKVDYAPMAKQLPLLKDRGSGTGFGKSKKQTRKRNKPNKRKKTNKRKKNGNRNKKSTKSTKSTKAQKAQKVW